MRKKNITVPHKKRTKKIPATVRQKKKESRLPVSEYEKIVAQAIEGICILREEKIIYANQSAARLFGYEKPEDLLGEHYQRYIAPASKPFILLNESDHPNKEILYHGVECKGLTAANDSIDLSLNAKKTLWNDQSAIIVTMMSMSERKSEEKDHVQWLWEQESLVAIDQQLAALVDLEQVVDVITLYARIFARADFVSFLFIDHMSGAGEWEGTRGSLRSAPAALFPLSKKQLDFFQQTKPLQLSIETISNDPMFSGFKPLLDEQLLYIYFLPLQIVLNLEALLVLGYRQDHRMSEREQRLLKSLADKSVVALANAHLYNKLLRREKELERLSEARVEAQEEERRRIAREIHDGLGQMLTAIKFNVEVLEDSQGLSPEERVKMEEMKNLLDNVMTEAREISYNLLPSVLEDFGLAPALQYYCEQFSRRMHIPVHFQHHGKQERYESSFEISLYRILQEALHNVAKHAEATSVEVQFLRDEQGVRLIIEDDGKGYVVQETLFRSPDTAGVGHVSMRERAASCGGKLFIESTPGKGTSLVVEIPHPAVREREEQNR